MSDEKMLENYRATIDAWREDIEAYDSLLALPLSSGRRLVYASFRLVTVACLRRLTQGVDEYAAPYVKSAEQFRKAVEGLIDAEDAVDGNKYSDPT